MTAQPHLTDFAPHATTTADTVIVRPDVSEHYWGYEVISNDRAITTSELMRGLYAFLTVSMTLAAFGVWFMPAMSFVGSAFVSKFIACLVLMCGAAMLARPAMRGTRVRVQVDTANGELREVVVGMFGHITTQANYGLDAVEAVKIVSSRSEPAYGQIQVRISGVGAIPVGDGALTSLRPLRDRLANDCGVDHRDHLRPVIWDGSFAP